MNDRIYNRTNRNILNEVHGSSISFWRRWYNTLFFGPHYKGRKYTCLLGFSAVLVSVLIDLDHIYLPKILNQRRPLHLPFLVVIWSCVLLYRSYHIGWIYKFMLRNKKWTTTLNFYHMAYTKDTLTH